MANNATGLDKRLVIYVNVDAETALSHGRAAYGNGQYAPTDEEISALSADERKALLEYTTGYTHLKIDSAVTDWAAIRAALSRDITARAEEGRLREIERNGLICGLLALPADAWLREWSKERAHDVPPYIDLYLTIPGYKASLSTVQDDPRIQARMKTEIEPLLLQRQEEYRAEKQQRQDALDALRARKAAELARVTEAVRVAALHEPTLTRAVNEGYPYTAAYFDLLAERFADKVFSLFGAVVYHEIDDDVWEHPNLKIEIRPNPSPESYVLHDTLVAAALECNQQLPADIGRWQVSPIYRFALKSGPITGILATLRTEVADREIMFSLENPGTEDETADE